MFKIKFLRNILLASLAMAITFPLYNIFIAYPSFINAVIEETENEAIRIATHLMSTSLFPKNTESDTYSLIVDPKAIETFRKNFNLMKIKVFSHAGSIIYSSDSKDIGKINKNAYFHEIVAKGSTYAKIVKKDTKSLEGQLVKADVVETYVPIMKDGMFLGAFEIYYDITTGKQRYDKLRSEDAILVISMAFGLLVLVIITSSRASRFITERKHAEEMTQLQLKRLNVLCSIEKAVTSSLDLQATLNHVVDQVTAHLGIDAATILLLKQHTQRLEYVVSEGFRSGALKHTKLRLGESNAGRAAMERRIISIPNLLEDSDGFVRSEQFGGEGFVCYFAIPLIAKGEVKGVLELFHRASINANPDWLDFLDTIADQAATAIDNAVLFDELQRSRNELVMAYDSTIIGWSLAMDMRDKETEGHSRRVTAMTMQIAHELGVEDDKLMHMRWGALLHDIGKIGVPDSILLKPGRLTEEERTIMQRHPQHAYDMLNEIDYLKPALDIPYYHHERWDGTGYPKGLNGEEIPLAARIFAVVDVWDALSSDRPYRTAWPEDKVIEHMRSRADSHFDPEVVKVFLNINCSGYKI